MRVWPGTDPAAHRPTYGSTRHLRPNGSGTARLPFVIAGPGEALDSAHPALYGRVALAVDLGRGAHAHRDRYVDSSTSACSACTDSSPDRRGGRSRRRSFGWPAD